MSIARVSPGSDLMDKLVVHTDDGSTQEFPLAEKRISIGRDETNTICLGDKSVSRHHATLQRVLKGFTIEDAQSTNGTLLREEGAQPVMLRRDQSRLAGRGTLELAPSVSGDSDACVHYELMCD